MADSELGYQAWSPAIFRFSTCIKGISQKSARHLGHRLRAGFASPGGLLPGPVEVHEI